MKQVEYYKNGNRTLRIKYEGIKKLLEKQDKEIERLTKQNKALNEMYELTKKEYIRRNNIINELIEDIPCLLEIINRNEKDIKVYQDEWIAIKSLENKLQELKGSE